MHVKRLYVEEGFLDGLDIEFKPGLNAIIGARGTGKTSLLELLRYAVNADAYTPDVRRTSTAQARAILNAGAVTIILDVAGQEVALRRTTTDKYPRLLTPPLHFDPPIVLSQNEIERLALDEPGKLRLLDDFRHEWAEIGPSITALQQQIASLTASIGDVAANTASLRDRAASIQISPPDLLVAQQKEDRALQALKTLQPVRERLATLARERSANTVDKDATAANIEAITKWSASVERVIRATPDVTPPPARPTTSDHLEEAMDLMGLAANALGEAHKLGRRAVDVLTVRLSELEADLGRIDDVSRPLRRQLDDAVSGAGELSQRVTEITQALAQHESIQQQLDSYSRHLEALLAERRRVLEHLEAERRRTFEDRREVANRLTRSLRPLVRVNVERAAVHGAYTDALIHALQGSGLHYNSLAPRIAERMSPRELAEAVERGDVATVAELADIPAERALRIIAQLGQGALADLLTAWVDDGVAISLLDGTQSKPTSELSTGQRCTAILPILLSHDERLLVIDQPEDNLDNAFIVDTLVKVITNRPPSSQLIVSTHNPNIPVLGEAARVIQLESTGRRGFVNCAGDLNDAEVVDAITSVMEGGREAFARRAEFYSRHRV